jgi:F0F1-type ATP synthase membrane subunit b/b'
MDAMLHALGGILLRAVPTFLLVIFLHYYLKIIFFKPLEKVLNQRYESTEGARKLAEASLQRAADKTAQYEAALKAEKTKLYAALEVRYKAMQERETKGIAAARQAADGSLKTAKEQLGADVEALADQIAGSILQGSAA